MKALIAAVLLALSANASAADTYKVPVVQMHGDHMDQVGWLTVPNEDGYAVLFCTLKTKTTAACLVYGKADHGPVIASTDIEFETKETGL